MTDRARWIYALPEDSPEAIRGIGLEEGLHVVEEDEGTKCFRLENDAANASLVAFPNLDLEVVLVEAAGGNIVPVLSKIIDRTGFFAQSTLLGTALDVHDPEAVKALKTLAHMVVTWDEDWSDLFLLHLASPDAVVRHEAVLALTVAVMVAREAGPAPVLLEEAIKREKFPKLRDTMRDALNLMNGITGRAVELKPEPS